MSDTNTDIDKQKDQKTQPERRPNRLVGGVVGLIAAVALAACANTENDRAHAKPIETMHVEPSTPTASAPTQETISPAENVPALVERLPGFGNRVSERERAMIRASTIKIAQHPKADRSNEWTGSCTGTKVAIDGDPYIITARHCFESYNVLGTFPSLNTGANGPDLHTTKDITNDLGTDVGIWTVENGKENRRNTASVNNVKLRYYPDIAILKVDESAPDAALFNKLPAIAYETALGQAPLPGSEAALYTLPESNVGINTSFFSTIH